MYISNTEKFDAIDKLIKQGREKENLEIELKNSKKLFDKDNKKNKEKQRDIAYEIIALANRHGGKLIFGINDDGTYEGKDIFNDDIDIQKCKAIIDDICYTQISPIVDYDLELVESNDVDLVIIKIPKRAKIPHAFINSKEGGEIKNRIYYIRTRHGKRLVGDNQLQWLFNYQDDADFSYEFRNVITYNKKTLEVSCSPIEQVSCWINYKNIIQTVALQCVKFSHENFYRNSISLNKSRKWFFVGVIPYIFINSLSSYFSSSWSIDIIRRHQSQQWVTRKDRDHTNELKVLSKDIPLFECWGTNGDIHIKFDDLAKIHNASVEDNYPLCVPKQTTIQIVKNMQSHNPDDSVKVIFKHPSFQFEFIFTCSNIAPGLAHAHPHWAIIMDDLENKDEKKFDDFYEHDLYKNYQSVTFECSFKASFEFPEQNIELFDKYYHYAQTIKDILKHDWNYDIFLDSMPDHNTYTLESKIDRVLNMLKSSQN
jgi:hypothetical protein